MAFTRQTKGMSAQMVELHCSQVMDWDSHPVCQGRENIHSSGAMLGMSSEELSNNEQEIIEFSELGAFIDSPLWTYSSGMRARLGFSIACFSNPDILLLDEVLSVGDSSFKRNPKLKLRTWLVVI